MLNITQKNPSEGVFNQTSETKSKYYQISVWEDEELRDQGIRYEIDPQELELYSIDEIKSFVVDTYNSEIKDFLGSIEVDEVDVKGRWIKSLYHISVDSDHELEVV